MTETAYPDRFVRLRLILKEERLSRLQKSCVMVIGLGGVGASCAEALARGGIGRLILLDRDVVEESNINRQALAFTSTIGQVKTDVMRRMVFEINPDCDVMAKQIFLTAENIPETLSSFPKPDYVIDCIDTVTQKLAAASWCIAQRIPILSSMGAANKLDPCQLKFSDIEKTTNCPLSRSMRRECKKRGIKRLEVLYSAEPPIAFHHDGVRGKAETLGSMSYMPPIMGQMLAGKVILRLAGLAPFAPPEKEPEKTEGAR